MYVHNSTYLLLIQLITMPVKLIETHTKGLKQDKFNTFQMFRHKSLTMGSDNPIKYYILRKLQLQETVTLLTLL